MARLNCTSFWERLLVPAFVFFFQKLYPFAAVNNDGRSIAAAAGGCILLRRETLTRAGGLESIRGALIDDCALAARIKSNGGRLWLGLAEDTISIRAYDGLGEIWKMVARTAYTQLNHSPLRLLGAIIGMAVAYLGAPGLLILYPCHGAPALADLGLLGWLLMSCAYIPTIRYYERPMLLAAALPAIAILFMGMTLDSARRHWIGEGGYWKGRMHGVG